MSPETILVEASWEVANKVGGIYTVVRTKAELVVQRHPQYVLVGPLFLHRQSSEFIEQAPPPRYAHIFEHLRAEGIQCVYGVWDIPGRPAVVLLNADHSSVDINALKGDLWNAFSLDTLRAGFDYDEPLRWAWGVGRLLELLEKSSSEPVLGHFHEWMAGLSILYLKTHRVPVKTVFHTHATMLGRTISGATDINLYDSLSELDFARIAKELHVEDKHSTEVACAKHADVFCTVSEITGLEAEYIIGRKPDVLLFNGILHEQYPSADHNSQEHVSAREKIRDFLSYYFFSHYTFDLEQSLTFFVSGRYEYRNKGLDILTRALSQLNHELRGDDQAKTVIVFFFIPQGTHGIKAEVLESREAFVATQQHVSQNADAITRNLLRSARNVHDLLATALLSQPTLDRLNQLAGMLEHVGTPPLATHYLENEEHDPIVAGFRAHGLLNREEDKVKVVLYPVYLTGEDGLMNITYEEAVVGSHLGIFPSYYEPWGYTPMEAIAMGVPAITTDLAGFGRFIQHQDKPGAFVLTRQNRSEQEVVSELVACMKHFVLLRQHERHQLQDAAKSLSTLTDWNVFIDQYFLAYKKAYDAR